MKNKAFIITLLSFIGLITLVILALFGTTNTLALVPVMFLLLSSFTLGMCNLMIGSTLKATKLFSIISIITFISTAIVLFYPTVYSILWNSVFSLHIGIIAWTLFHISPSTHRVIQVIARILIISTSILFLCILYGFMQHSIIFLLLKIALFLTSGILIIQFIMQNYTQKN